MRRAPPRRFVQFSLADGQLQGRQAVCPLNTLRSCAFSVRFGILRREWMLPTPHRPHRANHPAFD